MSRILTNRRMWLLTVMISSIVTMLFLHLYFVVGLLSAILTFYVVNFMIVRRCLEPLDDLSPNRQIKVIDTLIIGDCCSKSELSTRFDLRHALIITAPGRSMEASISILNHVASRLDGNQVCIVTSKKECERIGAMDLPFLSHLTKLELGLKDNPRERKYYLFYHPKTVVNCFLGIVSTHKTIECHNDELTEYCERKGYKLTLLQR